jgi:hemoglobin-like flavoprotein
MAAPDLLEACKAVLQYVDDHDSVVGAWGDIYEMLQKAVAKAEGRGEK